ncbi:MAG: GNAT family N-acetyltransferase [Reyranella sp.]|uniref:GNAT family N-acetyltransferase n=1 Tax=Reyranella sp. TaxID=1929291 RepID=UPI003D102565
MTTLLSVRDAIDVLAAEPLRHIVLLKQLLAYPDHVQVHRASGAAGTAMLVALDVSASAYDRQTYPRAAVAAFVSSDDPDLTASLLRTLPRNVGIVFKLSREADLAPVAARFAVERRTAFISFTSTGGCEPDPGVRVTSQPGDAAFELFAEQGHERSWLEPMLRAGKAFACVAGDEGETPSACIAFENYGSVWEVGGVVTAPAQRRKGFARRVVGTALAQLSGRGLAPRYQVEEHNTASIHLAQASGLVQFLTIAHYAHAC